MNKGTFSHAYYDNITETVFLYFKDTAVLPLSNDIEEFEIEEVCIYLSPDNYEKMIQYFKDHKTKETLF